MNLALEVEIAPVGHATPQRNAPHVEFIWDGAVRVFDKSNSVIDNIAVRLNADIVTAAFNLRKLFNFFYSSLNQSMPLYSILFELNILNES